MGNPLIFSLIQTPEHPKFSKLYAEMGIEEMQFASVRKVVSALKKHRPALIIAQFQYAFSNNYASNHISNLDTLLITLQQYGEPRPEFVFLVYKNEMEHYARLINHYQGFSRANHMLLLPAREAQMREILSQYLQAE